MEIIVPSILSERAIEEIHNKKMAIRGLNKGNPSTHRSAIRGLKPSAPKGIF